MRVGGSRPPPCAPSTPSTRGKIRGLFFSFLCFWGRLEIETGTETRFGTFRNKTFVSVVSLLYRNTETESFDVLIEPKQTNDQPKQFDREHILLFFTENLGFFGFFVFFVFLVFFRFVSKQFVSVVLLLY